MKAIIYECYPDLLLLISELIMDRPYCYKPKPVG